MLTRESAQADFYMRVYSNWKVFNMKRYEKFTKEQL
nr:MAG TPA: hypothetical protein [Caudoviricetes sp.]